MPTTNPVPMSTLQILEFNNRIVVEGETLVTQLFTYRLFFN
jgi:hypothetical protein